MTVIIKYFFAKSPFFATHPMTRSAHSSPALAAISHVLKSHSPIVITTKKDFDRFYESYKSDHRSQFPKEIEEICKATPGLSAQWIHGTTFDRLPLLVPKVQMADKIPKYGQLGRGIYATTHLACAIFFAYERATFYGPSIDIVVGRVIYDKYKLTKFSIDSRDQYGHPEWISFNEGSEIFANYDILESEIEGYSSLVQYKFNPRSFRNIVYVPAAVVQADTEAFERAKDVRDGFAMDWSDRIE